MREKAKRSTDKIESTGVLHQALFWTPVALLVLLPLTFSTAVPAVYALPKFVLLLVGSSLLAWLLVIHATRHWDKQAALRQWRHLKWMYLYVGVIALSTLFSVAPRVSLFGSNSNFMGVITRICFLICGLGLIVGIGTSEKRLRQTLWAIIICGGVVAAYAVAQFFGIDPFAPASLYTFSSPLGTVIRVCASIGHSNYLGNFLLYVAPLSLAFALAGDKKARLVAACITVLALLAIILSVARGAWFGIVVGLLCFAVLESRQALAKLLTNKKQLWRAALLVPAGLAVIIALIAFTPASRTLTERTQALMKEGLSSSGRLLLWRDSVKMLPAFALTGCGAEGFRKAFLLYKSPELARLSQPNNNESPHNSYLEVALSYGLLGLALYVAIIVFTLTTWLRARRQAVNANWRVILSGLIAAFVAALVHNLFIFDQLSTGLYFFAFIALAPAVANVFAERAVTHKASSVAQLSTIERQADQLPDTHRATAKSPAPSAQRLGLNRAATAVAAFIVLAALWYGTGLVAAELEFKKIFDPTIARNFPAIAAHCQQVADSPLPTGAYDFMVARALEAYAKSLSPALETQAQATSDNSDLAAIRQSALQLGISYAEKSLAHTNTPDLNYTTLASLALMSGDKDRLTFAAAEAVRYDPNNYYARWLLAEASLASGETEQAEQEAQKSLKLAPAFSNASAVLARVHNSDKEKAAQKWQTQLTRPPNGNGRGVPELIEYARQLTREGNFKKAKRKLLMALARASGNCPECHRELAKAYEKLRLYDDAIIEWETFAQLAPERASGEQVTMRVESLKQNLTAKVP